MGQNFKTRIMTEEFLHYLWQYRLFDPDLVTDNGEPLTILHPGTHNPDGGPDFFNSRIRIGATLWAGNVEIHVKASDWFSHRHQDDPAYDNVILHVVYENDVPVTDRSNGVIPALTLRGMFPGGIYERYQSFRQNQSRIPCSQLIGGVPVIHFNQWAPALVTERLEGKTSHIRRSLETCSWNWNEVFYQSLFRAFGFKINALPFELLAKSVPFRILQKHRNSQFQLEALLFGQAGMLTGEFTEEYPQRLLKEYEFLKGKYNLAPIGPGLWKYLRLRPSNFPTIRIAQVCALLQRAEDLLSAMLDLNRPEEFRDLFLVAASGYWDSHFTFGRISGSRPRHLGAESAMLIVLNLAVPFLFLYGKEKGIPRVTDTCFSLLENIPGEINSITATWKELGMPVASALETQALLQLKLNYCDRRRCLECRIGAWLLK
jgi:hypothetical protein